MTQERILIFGASLHTQYTIDIIEQEGKYQIVGILDVALRKDSVFAGYPILGKDEDLVTVAAHYHVSSGIVAIGDNFIRSHVVSKIGIIMPSFNFVSAIHPSVILGKNVAIGAGSLLMAGVIVNNDSVIGTHCFLATKASLDHDSILGNYSSLSPGVTTGGSVTIGQCSAIGLGANILHGMDIGNHALVGAGALVRSILRTMLSLLVFLRKRNVKQERSIYS